MTSFLASVEQFLRQQIAPRAAEIDQHPDALRDAFHALGDRNWLALRVPQVWGGAEIDAATFRQFQAQVARYSGALAFLHTQHQSAANFLYRSDNQPLKATYLPKMGQGAIAVGVGFSQLRRHGEPSLQAIPMDGGYLLEGTVPWVTGFDIFQTFIVAAVLPDQRGVYGLVPFRNTHQPTGGQISFGSPMPMAAMPATNTVTAKLQQWWLPDSQVVLIQPADGLAKSDVLNVLQHSFFALGCAQAGLDVIEGVWQEKAPAIADIAVPGFIQITHAALDQELNTCRRAIFTADSLPYEEQLHLRAWAIELAVRCAHAAVTSSAGQANLLQHPAQRIYREALIFTVAGQTTAVMEATLQRLTRQ